MTPHISIYDNLAPEDVAMLQALYSRSPASVDDHLKKVADKGSGSFMERYYVGYNHKSIGDCGTTTLFIEGVTMLCAKAIQDWPLYSGQEASTRYMDFSGVEFYNPLDTHSGSVIQEAWRIFYLRSQDELKAHLRAQYPKHADEDLRAYERAIGARCFDIMRGFLPAGAMTNLSWHTNLRQAADHLNWLVAHPDEPIARVAQSIFEMLRNKYPNSFASMFELEQAQYRLKYMRCEYFLDDPSSHFGGLSTNVTELDRKFLTSFQPLIDRPRGVEVPRALEEYGTITSEFLLDFGSFRDLQRHRNGIVRMPLLTTKLGFHPWYLEQLPEVLRESALRLIDQQVEKIGELDINPFLKQNYIAMGFLVPCRVTQGLPAFVYRIELRSNKTVHPTLRQVVLKEIEQFKKLFLNVALHVDEDPDSWTVRRGKQTITEKGENDG